MIKNHKSLFIAGCIIISAFIVVTTSYWIFSLAGGRPDILLSNIWSSRELIITWISAIVTILTPLSLIIKKVFEIASRRVSEQSTPIKVTVVIDGNPISLEASDVEGALKLAERFQALNPQIANKITPQSKPQIIARVPRKPKKRKS